MPNKVDRIRRLRLALEAVAQGIEQPAAGQIASEALDTDNYLAENAQNVVATRKSRTPVTLLADDFKHVAAQLLQAAKEADQA